MTLEEMVKIVCRRTWKVEKVYEKETEHNNSLEPPHFKEGAKIKFIADASGEGIKKFKIKNNGGLHKGKIVKIKPLTNGQPDENILYIYFYFGDSVANFDLVTLTFFLGDVFKPSEDFNGKDLKGDLEQATNQPWEQIKSSVVTYHVDHVDAENQTIGDEGHVNNHDKGGGIGR